MRENEKILKILEGLKESLFTTYKVKKVGLFGSYIKGEQKESSDIDVLADFSEDADLIDLVGLTQFLEEKLKRKIDIVPKTALRKELKSSILIGVVYI